MSMLINPYRFGAGATLVPVIAGTQRNIENMNWFGNTVNSGSPSTGDLIILHLSHGSNLNTGLPITWPSGFTEGGRLHSVGPCAAWAWKIAGGSEPSTYSASWGGSGTRSILSAIVFSVHDGIAGYSTTLVGSNSNNMISPAFSSTPPTSKRLTLYSFGWGGGTMTATPETLTPAASILQAPLFTTAGDYTWCSGQMSLIRDEPLSTYPAINTATSWTSNINGVTVATFNLAIKPKP